MSQEPMKNADIIITVSGGVIQSVIKPKGVTLVTRDYDVDAEAPNNPYCRQDENGDWFQECFFTAESQGDFMD